MYDNLPAAGRASAGPRRRGKGRPGAQPTAVSMQSRTLVRTEEKPCRRTPSRRTPQPENTEPENTEPENTEPENTQPADRPGQRRREGEGSTEETSAQASTEPDNSMAEGAANAEMQTSYERTPQGHRVTRRTISRREVKEETQETITETYPMPYQPPSPSGHPAPVG